MTDAQLPAHSTLGASGAHRWMPCPGSVRMAAQAPEDTGSEYANEGTAAHYLASECLIGEVDAWEFLGQEICVDPDGECFLISGLPKDDRDPNMIFIVDDDMVTHVQVYLDYVRERHAALGGELLVEHHFHMKDLHPKLHGTGDAVVVSPAEAAIDDIDLKYGVGIVVEPEDNVQLLYYAAGAVYELPDTEDIDTINMTIVQPRAPHRHGPIRSWSVTFDELSRWVEEELLPAVAETEKPDAYLRAGRHCRFCPAKAYLSEDGVVVCPAMINMLEALVTALSEQDPKTLEDWELAEYRTKCATVRILQKALDDVTFQRMMQGNTVPGVKLVQKRSDRTWKDGAEEQLVAQYGDDIYVKTLKSPTQAEKLRGGKAMVTKLAFKPDTGLTLKDNTDNSQGAIKPRTAAEAFAGVTKKT